MLKIKKIAVGLLMLLFTITPFVIPLQTTHAQGDWASNIWTSITSTINTVQDSISAAINIKEGFWSEILDVVAVSVAQKASQMMSQKISNWIASGLETPLFVDGDFKALFKDVGKSVLQQGLSTLLQFGDSIYTAPEGEFSVSKSVSRDNLPSWVMDYTRKFKTFTVESAQLPLGVENNKIYFEDVVTGVSLKEVTDFFDTDLLDPSYLFEDMPGKSMDINRMKKEAKDGKSARPSGPEDVIWRITIGFLDCTKISFTVNGKWEPTSSSEPKKVIDPAVFQPIAGKYACSEQSLPGGVNFARNIVNQQNKSFEDLLTNSFKELTGVEIEDFLNDSEVFLRNLKSGAVVSGKSFITGKDPYAPYDLLNDIDKNPIGVQLKLSEKLKTSMYGKLVAQKEELKSDGNLPEKKCTQVAEIKFRDGNTSEKICVEAVIQNPAGVVTGLSRKALESAFNFNENTATWQQALATAGINLVVGVIDGGVKYVSREIKENSSEKTAGIKGLGIFDWLNPETAEAAPVSNENPNQWRSITDREVDFSTLIEKINLTQEEAELLRQTSELYRPYPAKAYILDRECVLGPDFGYESRIKNLVQPRTADVSTKMQTAGEENAEAYQNLLTYLNKKTEEQINFVQQALSSNPFPGQQTFQNTIRKVRDEMRTVNQINNLAVEKRNISTQLLGIYNTIIATRTAGGTTMDLTPILTPVPKWPKPEEIRSSVINSNSLLISQNDLSIQNVNKVDSTGTSFFDPTDQDGDGIPDDQQNNQPEGDSDGDGLLDTVELAICKTYGLCDTKDYYVTKDKTDDYNVSPTSDWDMDDDKRDVFGVLVGGTDLEEFLGVDSSGEEISGSHNPKYIDYVDPGLLGAGELIPGQGINFTAPVNTGNVLVITDPTIDYNRLYYLSDLQAYNKEYTDFLDSFQNTINSEILAARRTLSRLVSQYISIEKDISSQTSLQKAKGDLETARQKNANIEDLIDQCYQIFYQIDKGTTVEKENIPRKPYSVLGFGLVSNVPDFKCQETAIDPKKITGQYCFGGDYGQSGIATLNIGNSLLELFYKSGSLRNSYVKFLRYTGANLYGFQNGVPIYHRNPNFLANELLDTQSVNDPYDIGTKPFIEIFNYGFKIPTDGDNNNKIQVWNQWKNPGELPISLNSGDSYEIGNNISRISNTQGIVYALNDPYALDRAEILYCQNRSLLYTDINNYNNSTFNQTQVGSYNYWFMNDGTLNHIINLDKQWSPINCSDWYVGSVDDYFPESNN